MAELTDLGSWLDGQPESRERCRQLEEQLAQEIHQISHELMVALTRADPPCELIHAVLAGMFKLGYARAKLDQDGSDPPDAERESSGPSMPIDELRRLMGVDDDEDDPTTPSPPSLET